MLHRVLGQRTRHLQLSYICELIQDYEHVVLMGDMNTDAKELLDTLPLKNLDLRAIHWAEYTFPRESLIESPKPSTIALLWQTGYPK